MQDLAAETTGHANALRRDRLVVGGALLFVILLTWGFLLAGAGMRMSGFEMTEMEARQMAQVLSGVGLMAMQPPAAWSLGTALLMFVMWWAMMVAMMLPTAFPMVLHFTTVHREQAAARPPYFATAVFGLGYLTVWGGFSALAVAVQWGLQEEGWLSPMLVVTDPWLDTLLLLGAGLYQFVPLQRRCLDHCRSCRKALQAGWRGEPGGAFATGLTHGLSCLGCCGPLMALLFLAGVMNLYWIAGLSLLVLLEKASPVGRPVGFGIGVLLLVLALWRLVWML